MSITASNISNTEPILHYQDGSLTRAVRSKGPDVWVFRWRERDGVKAKRVHRKRIIGTVDQYRTKSQAWRATESLRAEINTPPSVLTTVDGLWKHFKTVELYSKRSNRSMTTIDSYLSNIPNHILPRWGDVTLEDVKAPAVESWLDTLELAEGTKSKLRNQMSALFSHALRHELLKKENNPISTVRQKAKRADAPDVLTIDEMTAIVHELSRTEHRLAVMMAAITALRRSEIRGLKWSDVDWSNNWLNLQRGVVRKHLTDMKTENSRKPMPIPFELTQALRAWRNESAYPLPDDWVFASPAKHGKQPIWLETVLRVYVKPAAKAAGITKNVGWHTFRHSTATYLGAKGEQVKVIQELLRHSSPALTSAVYQQAYAEDKRAAQARLGGLLEAASTS